jgi:N-acetyltransferase
VEPHDAFQTHELKTDALNQASLAAIRHLGAVQEGVFRKHTVTASGRVRDTVYFSILDTEWPAVRSKLDDRLVRCASKTSNLPT